MEMKYGWGVNYFNLSWNSYKIVLITTSSSWYILWSLLEIVYLSFTNCFIIDIQGRLIFSGFPTALMLLNE